MKVLIIGGAGYVGSHLTGRLSRAGHAVTVFDRSFGGDAFSRHDQLWKIAYRRDRLWSEAVQITGDVNSRRSVKSALMLSRPDCIVYLAALPIISLAEKDPQEANRSMVRGLTNTLETARSSHFVKRFVYISSSMVYGHFETDPVPEDASVAPVNLYGGLKLAGEILTRSHCQRTEVEHVIVRPSGVYGATDMHGRVVQAFCEASLRRGRIEIVNGSDTYIDFTWIDDVVDGISRAATHPAAANETFNITAGDARNLEELLTIVQRLAPGAEVARTCHAQSGRPKRGSLDISKAHRLLGFRPTTDLESGVAKYLSFLRSGHATSHAAKRHASIPPFAAQLESA